MMRHIILLYIDINDFPHNLLQFTSNKNYVYIELFYCRNKTRTYIAKKKSKLFKI